MSQLDQPQPKVGARRAALLRDHLLVAARRARRWDYRHVALAPLRWRLLDAGIDRRRLQSPRCCDSLSLRVTYLPVGSAPAGVTGNWAAPRCAPGQGVPAAG